MAAANEVNLDYDLPPNIPTNSIPSSSAAERGDVSGLITVPATPALGFSRRMSPIGLVKVIGVRFMRTVRRGNLPFLILFFSCVVYFFAALTGVGYVEPPSETQILVPVDPQFKLGQPVFNPQGDTVSMARQRQHDALKSLEMEWATKKRPQEGQWMQRARDHGARRLPQRVEKLVYGQDEPKAVSPEPTSLDTENEPPEALEVASLTAEIEKPKGRHGKKKNAAAEEEEDEIEFKVVNLKEKEEPTPAKLAEREDGQGDERVLQAAAKAAPVIDETKEEEKVIETAVAGTTESEAL